jgi:hypothetical protein
MRFHSLYKFLDRLSSNIVILSSSMPAAPRLAFTRWYASGRRQAAACEAAAHGEADL